MQSYLSFKKDVEAILKTLGRNTKTLLVEYQFFFPLAYESKDRSHISLESRHLDEGADYPDEVPRSDLAIDIHHA